MMIDLSGIYIRELENRLRIFDRHYKKYETSSHIMYKGIVSGMKYMIEIGKYSRLVNVRIGKIDIKPISLDDIVMPDIVMKTLNAYINGEVWI